MKKYYERIAVLGAVMCAFALPSCRKNVIEVRDDCPATVVFKASPALPLNLSSRFRLCVFTDGEPRFINDVSSVSTMNAGVAFVLDRAASLEASATYGWPYGDEWYDGGALSIPYGQMCPEAGGAYASLPFPSVEEETEPVGLAFQPLYREVMVDVAGAAGLTSSVSFSCLVGGYSWPGLQPVAGRFNCVQVFEGDGFATVRVPVVPDGEEVEMVFVSTDASGATVYGPEHRKVSGAELAAGRHSVRFAVELN